MPSGQHGSPFSPLRIGTGCTPSSPSASRAQYRTVMNSLRRLATDLAISGSSSGSGTSSGGSVYISAAASACAPPGSTPESSVAMTVMTAWP